LAPIVIVGAGLAGGKAAVTLREEGYSGRLCLIGDEPGPPFGRPPLSKTYLQGREGLEGWLVEPASWYLDHEVELIHDTVVRVDPSAGLVHLRSNDPIAYRRLLVATGGRNRRPDIPGAGLEGVFQLRTRAQCDTIRAAAHAGAHAVVVGMSFIGCEVAASLRQLGVRVTAIADRPPLEAVLGPEVAGVIASIHRDAGVDLVTDDRARSFQGAGRLQEVSTAKGKRIACDLAILAVGIEPNVEALTGAGLDIDNGVRVDAHCETNVPGIYAAGDVANHAHPVFGRIRVEHYNNAEKQGAAAARAMLGASAPYAYVHSFWSDQYQHKLEYVGHTREWDRFVVAGNLEERRFLGFYLEAGRLAAAVGLNRGGDPELEPDSELAIVSRMIARGSRPVLTDLEKGVLASD